MTVIAQDDHLTAGAWAACAFKLVRRLRILARYSHLVAIFLAQFRLDIRLPLQFYT